MAVYFITESEIKELTTVENNVDSTFITPFLSIAQEIHVKPVLGDALYQELEGQVSGSSLTALNTALIAKIKPALAQWVAYEALPFIHSRITNKGLVNKSGNESANISDSLFFNMRKTIKQTAEVYEQQYINYLCENRSSFPLYKSDSDYTGNYGFGNQNGLIFY